MRRDPANPTWDRRDPAWDPDRDYGTSQVGSRQSHLGSRVNPRRDTAWNSDWDYGTSQVGSRQSHLGFRVNPRQDPARSRWDPTWHPRWDLIYPAWDPGFIPGVIVGIPPLRFPGVILPEIHVGGIPAGILTWIMQFLGGIQETIPPRNCKKKKTCKLTHLKC